MEKIVFFGDSYTYGIGLDLKWDDERRRPNPLGWANILCEMRNASGRNLSRPGASNLQILWGMLNAEIDPDEIIIVQWSFWNRDCLLDEDDLVKITPWDESSRPYYELHSNSDMIKRNYLNIHHGHLWLKQKSNSFLMLANNKYYKKNDASGNEQWKHLTDEMIHHFSTFVECDLAEDKIHQGPESNIKWANYVNELLDSKLKG